MEAGAQTAFLHLVHPENGINLMKFMDSNIDLFFILDRQGAILHVNQTVLNRLGYTREELIGQSVLFVHPKHRHSEAFKNVTEMLAGERDSCPVPLVTKDGSLLLVETRVSEGQWDGQPVLFGISRDMSRLKASEEKFQKAFHSAGSMMAISTLSDGRYLEVNQAFTELLGYTRQETLGKTSRDLGVLDDIALRPQVVEHLRSKGALRNIEVRLKTKDERRIIALFNLDLIWINDEECLMTSAVDISERKAQEEEIRHANHALEATVEKKMRELLDAQLATITALSNITEQRDHNTGDHIGRLKESCKIVATRLARKPGFETIDTDFIENLQNASALHDIGKVGIPDSILLKPGKLTEEEFTVMKRHPLIGAKVLEEVLRKHPDNPYIRMGYDITLSHHEKWDGSGYPNGLKGKEIPLSAQILSICDVYDAIRSERPYKAAKPHTECMLILKSSRDKAFQAALVNAFIEAEAEILELYNHCL